ncbi:MULTISPECIES: hypothetical protein [Legionella]|uniref:Uncharacterized protein n=1 Tax=Legionella drozanskii LLAP-1 TaxID=1212489 RepID=A0A0W0SLR7_9GAMM|nr:MULTISPECIES: hypothetical protein [Legionella]KTC84252.1 hypothetical protein Ldro_3058 [Legionella drozanskii LLAP-1]PJE07197.1 MAG: hypothetical protein CK430_14350 [Legionella sp.]
MKNILSRVILSRRQVKTVDGAINPKIIFLNNGLIITSIITCIMGIVRWHDAVIMSVIDFSYTAIGIV